MWIIFSASAAAIFKYTENIIFPTRLGTDIYCMRISTYLSGEQKSRYWLYHTLHLRCCNESVYVSQLSVNNCRLQSRAGLTRRIELRFSGPQPEVLTTIRTPPKFTILWGGWWRYRKPYIGLILLFAETLVFSPVRTVVFIIFLLIRMYNSHDTRATLFVDQKKPRQDQNSIIIRITR